MDTLRRSRPDNSDNGLQLNRWFRQGQKNLSSLYQQSLNKYHQLTAAQKLLFWLLAIFNLVLLVLFLQHKDEIFDMIVPYAKRWRSVKAGWMLPWGLILLGSFPPMVGYSTIVMFCGYIYGFKSGWLIASTATVFGSSLSYLALRFFFSDFAQRLTNRYPKFKMFVMVVEHDGLRLLTMIRLLPLPYSVANALLSTIPSVTLFHFSAATALSTPKLFIHIFIGSQLAQIAEHGGEMTLIGKSMSWLGMLLGGAAAAIVATVVNNTMEARASELEEGLPVPESGSAGGRRSSEYRD